MRLFKYELLKVVSRRLFWAFLAAAMAVNILALWWFNRPEGLPHSETKALFQELRPLGLEEKLARIQEERELMDAYQARDSLADIYAWFADDPQYVADSQAAYDAMQERFGDRIRSRYTGAQAMGQQKLLDRIKEELAKPRYSASTYAAYLDNIDQRAEDALESAIFAQAADGFSRANILKTQADFADMRDTEIRYDVNLGLDLLYDSPATDIILLLIIVAVCLALITDEKDKRLFLLVKSTPGGAGRTLAAKLSAMAVCVAGTGLLVFACNAAYGEAVYGLGDLHRSIQSVPAMMGSTLKLSLLQFTGLFLLVKIAGLFILGMLVMLFAIHTRHAILMLFMTAVTAVGSTLLTAIPALSDFNWLRYLNPAVLIRPFDVLKSYTNLRFFGRPVNLIPVFLLFAGILFAGLLAADTLSFIRRRGLENNRDLFKLKRTRFTRPRVHAGWKWFEFRKLAFTNKAAFLLAAFALFQFVYAPEAPVHDSTHHYFKLTMQRMEGPLDDGKEQYLLTEKAKYDKARAALEDLEARYGRGEIDIEVLIDEAEPYRKILVNEAAFTMIYERYEYIRKTGHAQFLYDSGYARLLGLTDADEGLASGMRMVAMLILCLCGVFAVEYRTGMVRVLGATRRGHGDTVRFKLLLSGLAALAVFACAYLPDLLYIGRHYGYRGLGVPLASIPPSELGGFPAALGGLPVGAFVVLFFGLRLLVCLAVALMAVALSLAVRHNVYAALCALGLLLAPLFLHLLGITLLDPVSLLTPLTTGGMFLYLPAWRSAATMLALCAAGAAGGVFVVRRFGRANPVSDR